MTPIRNSKSRLICYIDVDTKTVEILVKGIRTTIRFMPDGSVRIKDDDM